MSEIERLQAANAALEAKADTLEAELASANEQLAEASAERDRYHVMADNYCALGMDCRQKLAEAKTTISGLELACQIEQDRAETAEARVKELERELSNVSLSHQHLRPKYMSALERIAELGRENNGLFMLIDDIDTAGDMFKPEINNYFRYVNECCRKAHAGGGAVNRLNRLTAEVRRAAYERAVEVIQEAMGHMASPLAPYNHGVMDCIYKCQDALRKEMDGGK